MKRFGRVVLLLAALAAGAITTGVEAASSGRFTLRGTVTSVVDGDTIVVTLGSGRTERVRLIGIAAPERGRCFAAKAAAAARRLAQGKRVTLRGDGTQATRDRYRRLLAYVWLPGGKDLGYQLIAGGFGKAYVFGRDFARLGAYRNAEALGRRRSSSVWKCGSDDDGQPPCHPSYRGACLDPNASDYDCEDGSGNGPRYTGRVEVVGPDEFGLDADGDGIGCED